MKKFFVCLAAAMMTLSMSAASFGILVNGKMFYEGSHNADFEGFTQYLAHVPFKNGDYFQLYDADNKAAWVKPLNASSVEGFSYDEANGKYHATVTGCYDCYIKIKNGQDELYIGPGSADCGEGVDITSAVNPPVNPGGVEGNPRYYYKLYSPADEKWYEPSEETIFDHGVAEVVEYVGDQAYVFILFQVDNQDGAQYFAKEYVDDSHTQATFYPQADAPACEKWRLPAGATNLYLYDNGDGSLTMSIAPIPGMTLADPQPVQGIESTVATEKAHKTIINGELRIVRGERVFDATGREL